MNRPLRSSLIIAPAAGMMMLASGCAADHSYADFPPPGNPGRPDAAVASPAVPLAELSIKPTPLPPTKGPGVDPQPIPPREPMHGGHMRMPGMNHSKMKMRDHANKHVPDDERKGADQ